MKVILLILALVLRASYAQSSCENIVIPDQCPVGVDDVTGCACQCAGDNCEGCTASICTTAAPDTTLAPEPTTTCFCPTPAPVQPTTAPPTAKSNKGGSGSGVGECDCDKTYKLREIRFVYQGSVANVDIKVFRDGKENDYPWQDNVCEFSNVQPNEEITCDLWAGSNFRYFENETPFIITGAGGYQCVGQYHTSCSSDIVGVAAGEADSGGYPACTDLIASGWRDGNPTDNNDCDDGVEPCPCDVVPPVEGTTSTFVPSFCDKKFGDKCYCTNQIGVTPSPTAAVQSKSKSKKGKSGKKGGSTGGLGYGDCDCDKDYGMKTLRFLWQGADTVDIIFVEKGGATLCTVTDVAQGEEASCDASASGQFTKFSTNTYMQVNTAGTNSEVCQAEVHTSCSSDIVGGYGDGGCGTDLIVSGWSDGNPNANDCDDGYDICEGEIYTEPLYEEEEETVEINYDDSPEDAEVIIDDVCFCSNRDETANVDLSSLTTTAAPASSGKGKKGKSNQNGWGFPTVGDDDCDCDGGVTSISFVYKGTGVASSVVAYVDEVEDGNELCISDNVSFGEEITCTVEATQYTKLAKETYICSTKNGETTCGSWHTSCSRDFVGWVAVGNDDFVASGWKGMNNQGDCDDGFDPCECGDCGQFDEGQQSECSAMTGCYFDEDMAVCKSSGNNGYYSQGGVDRNQVTFAVGVVFGVVGFMAF